MTLELRGICSFFSHPFARKVILLKEIKHSFVSTGKNIIIDVAIFSHDVTRRMRENRLTLDRQQPQTSDFRNSGSQGNSSSGLYGRTSFISLPFFGNSKSLGCLQKAAASRSSLSSANTQQMSRPFVPDPQRKSNVHKRVASFVSCFLTVLKHIVVS